MRRRLSGKVEACVFVGTVGKFDEDDADILHHRHQSSCEVFGLRLFLIAGTWVYQVSTPIYQLGDAHQKLFLSGRWRYLQSRHAAA